MPILDEHTFDFFSRSAEQTRRIGMRLGSLLRSGDMVGLQGELGAGKTTLVQGIVQGWGSIDAASSPTFVLVNEYRRGAQERLFHLDAYRIDSPAEAMELDLDRMLMQGALVIEWAERIASILPRERLWVHLDYVDEEQRRLCFTALGSRYDRLLNDLRQVLFGVA